MGQENLLQCTRLEQMRIFTSTLTVLMTQVKVQLASMNAFLPDVSNSHHLTQQLRDRYRPAGHQGRRKNFSHPCQLMEQLIPTIGFPSKF